MYSTGRGANSIIVSHYRRENRASLSSEPKLKFSTGVLHWSALTVQFFITIEHNTESAKVSHFNY
jgi:hypothetical protein